MNLNKSQLSLLITFFSMSIVILLLFNIHLGGIKEDEYVIEMSLADEDIEKLLEEEEKRLEEMEANNDPIKHYINFIINSWDWYVVPIIIIGSDRSYERVRTTSFL